MKDFVIIVVKSPIVQKTDLILKLSLVESLKNCLEVSSGFEGGYLANLEFHD